MENMVTNSTNHEQGEFTSKIATNMEHKTIDHVHEHIEECKGTTL